MDDYGEDPLAACCLMFFVLLLLPLVWRFFDLSFVFRILFIYIVGFVQSFFYTNHLTTPSKMWGLWCLQDAVGTSLLARLTRDCSLARYKLWLNNGVRKALGNAGATMTSGGQAVRLTDRLHFLDRYTISSKVVCWDEDSLYVEHEVTRCSDNRQVALVVARERLQGTTPNDLAVASCGCRLTTPTPPCLVDCWLQCTDANMSEVNPYCFLKHRTEPPRSREHTNTHRIHIHLHKATPSCSHSRCTNIQVDASSASQHSYMHCTHIEIPYCTMDAEPRRETEMEKKLD